MDNQIEKMADNAMRASQGGGQSKMLQYMLARLAQQKAPARSNKEGIGRVLGTFLLPMIAQGAQTWKESYDQRGKNKTDADVLYERLKNGETLSPEDQAFFAQMQKNYPDRYAPLPQSGGQQPAPQQPAPQQPAPQGAQPPAPANNAVRSALEDYINQNVSGADFWRHPNLTSAVVNNSPADETAKALQAEVPPLNLTGAALVQEAEDRLREALGGKPKGWLLNALSYGR